VEENLYSASSFITWNSASFCVRDAPPPANQLTTIPEGILLNGQSCTNWYHWLINILPKAFIVETSLDLAPQIPYLVSNSIQGTRMEEALRLIAGRDRPILFLEDKPHCVQRAIVVETPVREVYRPKNILSPVGWSDIGTFHSEIMTNYRSHIIERALVNQRETLIDYSSRLFLTRENVSRPFNESEVGALLAGMGFASVSLEKLSFDQQVASMAAAKVVIGPTGAQWAGWLFSDRAVGIILVPPFLRKSSLFAKLGAIGASELFEFTINTSDVAWSQYNTTRVHATVDLNQLSVFLGHFSNGKEDGW
jgi:capsular polysaccharide biosynthesis protein